MYVTRISFILSTLYFLLYTNIIMKVSIITTTYNSAKTIEETINSVLGQTYPDIEYIIIDDGSTDNTLALVRKFESKIGKIVPVAHGGMYYAMNKGIELATGDVVGIMNSDDFYYSDDVIETVVNEFKKSGADCLWGDLVIVDKNNTSKVVRNWKSSPYGPGLFQKGWHPPHTAFFVKKHVYDKFGLFRTDLSTAADYELMLRFLEKDAISSSYIPKVLVKMRSGGSSSRSMLSWIRGNVASYKAFGMNGLHVNISFLFTKPFRKIEQFFR